MIDTFLHIWTKILESNLFNFVLMLILLDWIVKKGTTNTLIDNDPNIHLNNNDRWVQK